MIAFMLEPSDAAALLAQLPPGLSDGTGLHITLAYLGDAAAAAARQTEIQAALQALAAKTGPITGTVAGYGRFTNDATGAEPLYASFDSPQLPALRQAIVQALAPILPVDDTHGFTPHITLAYLPDDFPTPNLDMPVLQITFDELTLAIGETCFCIPLNSAAPRPMLVSVKALGDWMLDVLGIPFGGPIKGRDVAGERFTPDTQLHLDRFNPLVLYYHSFDEAGNPQGTPEEIGAIVSHETRSDGVWFKVLLDKASTYARKVWSAAQKGLARASSGTAEHLIRMTADGTIENWPVVELSLFDAAGGRQPVNAYAVALPAMKARYAAAHKPMPIPTRIHGVKAGQPAPDGAPRPIRVHLPASSKPVRLETHS